MEAQWRRDDGLNAHWSSTRSMCWMDAQPLVWCPPCHRKKIYVAARQSTNLWRNPVYSHSFVKYPFSSHDFCFSSLNFPASLFYLSAQRHLSQCFGPFKEHFCWAFSVGCNFFWKQTKAQYNHSSNREVPFYFSQRPPITGRRCNLKQFWSVVRCVSFSSRVLLQQDDEVCVCLSLYMSECRL